MSVHTVSLFTNSCVVMPVVGVSRILQLDRILVSLFTVWSILSLEIFPYSTVWIYLLKYPSNLLIVQQKKNTNKLKSGQNAVFCANFGGKKD